MIAGPQEHYDPDTLRRVLDDDLPKHEVTCIEDHLSRCPTCRGQIEALAGERQWWQETVGVLSDSAVCAPVGSDQTSGKSATPTEACLDWIRPLLTPARTHSQGMGSIDQYKVLEILGQGGMGVVLRGFDPELNRPVAIKVLSPHLAGVGAARARFMREAQAAANIVHPAIVPIYSVVTAARLPYLVMPCIHGGNLQQRLDHDGPLELEETLRIGVQVAEGLAAAHHHGVIHRDIKPANILREEGNGRVLISDFGLARALDDATLTLSGMIAGTPQYMSPEQARGEAIDARSDLFSLGSLLYALSTGRPPYRDGSPLAILRKITESRPKPIHHVNERIPIWFDELVSQLMTLDPCKRIATAEAAADLLRSAHAHVCNPSVHPRPVSVRSGRRRAMKKATLFGAMLFGAMLLSAAVWMMTSGMEPRLLSTERNATSNSAAPSTPDTNTTDPVMQLHGTPVPEAASTGLFADDSLRWQNWTIPSELHSIQQKLVELESTMAIEKGESSETLLPKPAIEESSLK